MDNNKRWDEMEKEDLSHSNQRKKETVKEESTAAVPVQKNIEAILQLEKKSVKGRSTAERLADKITSFAGSTPFIILHALFFGGWIIVNGNIIPGITPFNPFPFSFLTLMVSMEAIFLTLLVLMNQNRMTKEADKRAHLELQINMLAEQETTMILRLVQKISKHLGLEEVMDESLKDLSEKTDVNRVAQTFDEKSS